MGSCPARKEAEASFYPEFAPRSPGHATQRSLDSISLAQPLTSGGGLEGS